MTFLKWNFWILMAMLCPTAMGQAVLGVTNTQFHPQGQFIGPYQQYLFVSCNQSDTTLPVDSGQVFNAAPSYGLALVGYERVAQEEKLQPASRAWSVISYTLLGLSTAFTIADQAGAWKIGSEEHPAKWKAAVPAVGLALPLLIQAVKSNRPGSEVVPESDRLPLSFRIPGKGCVQYKVYATQR